MQEIRETVEMTQCPLVGTWRLKSFSVMKADGARIYPFGHDVVGYIVYTGEQLCSVSFMSANRPRFESDDMRGGTPTELAAALSTYNSYRGTYEYLGDRVIHHVETSLYPNWTGVDQERLLELEGDEVTLSTPPLLVDGAQVTAHLTWERVA